MSMSSISISKRLLCPCQRSYYIEYCSCSSHEHFGACRRRTPRALRRSEGREQRISSRPFRCHPQVCPSCRCSPSACSGEKIRKRCVRCPASTTALRGMCRQQGFVGACRTAFMLRCPLMPGYDASTSSPPALRPIRYCFVAQRQSCPDAEWAEAVRVPKWQIVTTTLGHRSTQMDACPAT